MYNQQIRTFICVVEYGSFSKAAEQLYLSTVSVMKQINALEERLDTKLVERSHLGISLTETGSVIYRQAKKIIELSDDAYREVRRLEKRATKPLIRLATSLLHPSREVTKLWEAVDEGDFPFAIDLIPFLDNENGLFGIMERLGTDIDCFVSIFPFALWKNRCNFLPLGKYNCCCAVPITHPLAAKDYLKWEDLYGQSLMLIKQGASEELDSIREDLINEHPSVKIIDAPYLYDAGVFNKCVQMGCLLEIPELWHDFHPSLKTIPVEWDYPLTFGVVYAKKPNANVRAFIQKVADLMEHEN